MTTLGAPAILGSTRTGIEQLNKRKNDVMRRFPARVFLGFWFTAVFAAVHVASGAPPVDADGRPLITKLGTIDCNMVETSPIVFNNKLYRYESVRSEHASNTTGDTYSRFVDVAAGTTTPSFAAGYHLGSAFVKDDTMYVYGVPGWGASTICEFSSTDLQTWSSPRPVLEQPLDWKIYNTSVCKAEGERYVMGFEVGAPTSVVGTPFTTRFAESTDLQNWALLPEESGVYSKDKYVACPTLRFLDDGYFYMIHLEYILSPRSFESHIVRSTDLIDWESSPLNPVLQFSDEDKQTGNPESHPNFHPNGDPTQAQLDHIAAIVNCNNSDVDFCEFDGKVVINYSWGNQYANGNFLAEAVYEGTEAEFLQGWFPVPEPSMLGLLATGSAALLACGLARARRKRK